MRLAARRVRLHDVVINKLTQLLQMYVKHVNAAASSSNVKLDEKLMLLARFASLRLHE